MKMAKTSRLAGYEAAGTGCTRVSPSQSEVADVGAGVDFDEESVASADMVSSAGMDGADAGLQGDTEARIFLRCAREIGRMVRMSVGECSRLKVSAIESEQAWPQPLLNMISTLLFFWRKTSMM